MEGFFDLILPNTGLRCLASPNGRGLQHLFSATNGDLARAAAMLDHKAGRTVYHACATFKEAGRRTQSNVAAVRSFWMDIDVGPSKPYAKFSHAVKAVYAFCDTVGIVRPYVVKSGVGVHAYWPCDRDMSPAEWKVAAQLLKEAAKRYGLGQDPSRTADEASILRPVGTTHRKGEPKPVIMAVEGTITTLMAFQTALAGWLGESDPAAPAGIDGLGAPPAGLGFTCTNNDLSGGMDYPPTYAAKIAEKCGVMALMRDTKGNIDQPTWYGALGVIAFCEDRDIAHEWSNGHPQYSHAETEAKLAQASKFKPTTCSKLSDALPNICAACPHNGKIASPIGLGMVAARAGNSASAPTPLPRKNLPVPPFEDQFLPVPLRRWAKDLADTHPGPYDFAGTNVLVVAGALLGNRLGLNFKRQTLWVETPNAWGMCIGDVSAMKTPMLTPFTGALVRLDAEADKAHQAALQQYLANKVAHEAVEGQIARNAKAAANVGKPYTPPPLSLPPERPEPRRTHTGDTTYEALGMLCKHNPTGVLVVQDELSGWLGHLSKEENRVARAFFLSGHTGQQSYRLNRIGRGELNLPRFCLSVVGNIQPPLLHRLLIDAARNGFGADGLAQRFGMMTFPDPLNQQDLVDVRGDLHAAGIGEQALRTLAATDPAKVGAVVPLGGGIPYLTLSPEASRVFQSWYRWQSRESQDADQSAAYRDHVRKLPKVVATVALTTQLLEHEGGEITGSVMERAVAAALYYAAHARRVYTLANDPSYEPAQLIARRISAGEVVGTLTARQVQRWNWSGCHNAQRANEVLSALEDYGWLVRLPQPKNDTGGRPTIKWEVHPGARGAKWE